MLCTLSVSIMKTDGVCCSHVCIREERQILCQWDMQEGLSASPSAALNWKRKQKTQIYLARERLTCWVRDYMLILRDLLIVQVYLFNIELRMEPWSASFVCKVRLVPDHQHVENNCASIGTHSHTHTQSAPERCVCTVRHYVNVLYPNTTLIKIHRNAK